MRFTIILFTMWTAGISSAALVTGRSAPEAAGSLWQSPAPPGERSAVGTLDRVDPTASEIVVGTAAGTMTFVVQHNATIRQGSKTLKPAELASHKGERVKVRYREAAGQRRTDWIMLAVPAKRQATPF